MSLAKNLSFNVGIYRWFGSLDELKFLLKKHDCWAKGNGAVPEAIKRKNQT